MKENTIQEKINMINECLKNISNELYNDENIDDYEIILEETTGYTSMIDNKTYKMYKIMIEEKNILK